MKYVIFIILITISPCYAQTTSPLLPTEQFRKFHKLSVDDGLSQNLVLFMHQDIQGFLWFGSAGGLDRFDGIEFKTYRNIKGLVKQPIYFYSCIENYDSSFWISTEFGLMLFDPVSNSAQMFTPPPDLTFQSGAMDIHHFTFINDSTILFGLVGKGLLQFNISSKKFSLIYKTHSNSGRPSGDIIGILPQNANKTFIVCYDQILLYDYKMSRIISLLKLPEGKLANCVWSDNESGRIFIGTTKGILEFQNNKLISAGFPNPIGIELNKISVQTIYKDTKGTFWIGTENGVVAINKNNERALYYSNHPADPVSIQPGEIILFFEDRSENLWISIQNFGVNRVDLKKDKFHSINNHAGFPKQLTSILVRDIHLDKNDNLWVAADGVTNIDLLKNEIKFYSSSQTQGRNYPENSRQICSLNDTLLSILADKKIYIFNTNSSEVKELQISGISINNINRMYIRSGTGNLLCVTRDSIFEINPIQKVFIKTILKFSEQTMVPSITVIDDVLEDAAGNVWFGTSFGLIYWNELESSFKLVSDTTQSTIVLPSLTVTSLAFYGTDILWIGTTAGLYKYDLGKQTIKGFYVKDGLPNDKIWSVAVDKKGTVWATSNRGLFRLRELPDGKIIIHSYTIDDGLPSNEFSMAIVATDSRGSMYFGTVNGIVYFHPDSVEDNPNTSPIAITDFKINGVSVPTEREISFTKELKISYEKKVISLRYAALDFSNPLLTHYAYKLEGYDEQWIEAGRRREAIYTNLDPGSYTLLIRSANKDGVWNEKPLSIIIEIIPPFWMTWWFRLIILLGTILIVGGSVRYLELKKIKQKIKTLEEKQALEKERTRIARDMHDEIGANLTRISLLSGIINSQPDKEKNNASLIQITDSVNETIEKLDVIVWAVNPSNDNLKNLTAYISEYAENFFEASEIKCRFSLPDTIYEINLTSEKRHHLFLVVKEALNNVLKYSQARSVSISLIIESSFFTFIIKDDGRGFCPESISSTSNGIKNNKERIDLIGGEFELISEVSKGTEIRLKIFI